MVAYVLEKRQHLIIGRVIGNEEANIGVVQHSSDTDQASSTTGDDGNVLPAILAVLALTVHRVVHGSHSFTQGLDTGRGAVLSSSYGDVDGRRTLEAALDVILDLGSTLTKVGPEVRLLQEAILGCSLSAPDHTSGGTSRI